MVPVGALRLVPAFFGSLLMPAVYSLLIEVGISPYAGALAALVMIFGELLVTVFYLKYDVLNSASPLVSPS